MQGKPNGLKNERGKGGGVKNERNEWKGDTVGSNNRQEEGGREGGIIKMKDNEKKKGNW